MPRSTSYRCTSEALDILEQAWLNPYLSYRGRYWSFEQLGMVPRPLQHPSPPIWATVRSTEAAAEAAKRGHRLCTGFLDTDAVVRLFDVYREVAGHMYTAERLAIRRCIFVAKTEGGAREHARAAQAQMPSILDDDIVVGTPAQVTEQILLQLGR
ncbi:MAG TPA: LLM class flavin-dependent oxidoreductase, partial [Xylella taiwanensis]